MADLEAASPAVAVARPHGWRLDWVDPARRIARADRRRVGHGWSVEGSGSRMGRHPARTSRRRLRVRVLAGADRWPSAEPRRRRGRRRSRCAATLPGPGRRPSPWPPATRSTGAALLTIEAMKMQNEVRAPRAGTVGPSRVEVGAPWPDGRAALSALAPCLGSVASGYNRGADEPSPSSRAAPSRTVRDLAASRSSRSVRPGGPGGLRSGDATLGEPGAFPFTRGIQPTMATAAGCGRCASTPGFGSAAETNRRFRYLLEQRPDRPVGRLRPAHPDGLRLRRPDGASARWAASACRSTRSTTWSCSSTGSPLGRGHAPR